MALLSVEVLMGGLHSTYLISANLDNSIGASVIYFCCYYLIPESSTCLHPADVTNEMHFSLRMKIMLSLCDCNHMSSTNTTGAKPIWSQHRHVAAVPKGWFPC